MDAQRRKPGHVLGGHADTRERAERHCGRRQPRGARAGGGSFQGSVGSGVVTGARLAPGGGRG